MSPQDIARLIKEETKELGERFDVFEHAWDVVEQCCAHLRDDLSMANDVMVRSLRAHLRETRLWSNYVPTAHLPGRRFVAKDRRSCLQTFGGMPESVFPGPATYLLIRVYHFDLFCRTLSLCQKHTCVCILRKVVYLMFPHSHLQSNVIRICTRIECEEMSKFTPKGLASR